MPIVESVPAPPPAAALSCACGDLNPGDGVHKHVTPQVDTNALFKTMPHKFILSKQAQTIRDTHNMPALLWE